MPLTEGQRKFLNQNIAKGGEIIVFDVVQNKSTRIKEARQRDLCIRCAGPGHFASECKATRQSSSGTAVYGQPPYGQPEFQQPYGGQQYGQPQYGQPYNGQPPYGGGPPYQYQERRY